MFGGAAGSFAPHLCGACVWAHPAAMTAVKDALVSLGWFVANIWHAFFLFTLSVFWMSFGALVGVAGNQRLGLLFARRFWSPGIHWASGARVDVRGLDKVDWTKPCVIVVNHQSMFDIASLQLGLPANLRFIAKAELMAIPFLGHYMRGVGMIPIDRGNTTESVARLEAQARRIVDDCACTIAFAEGTRSRTGAIAPFKKGAFMLALTAQVPIVPVSIEGARKVLPPDGFRVRPGVIRIDVGDPISTVGKGVADRDALMQQAHDAVVAMNVAAGGLGDASVAIELGVTARKALAPKVSRP